MYNQYAILNKKSELFIEYYNNTELLKYDINTILTNYHSTINKK